MGMDQTICGTDKKHSTVTASSDRRKQLLELQFLDSGTLYEQRSNEITERLTIFLSPGLPHAHPH